MSISSGSTGGISDIDYKKHIDTSTQEKTKPSLISADKTDIIISLLMQIKDAISFMGNSERTRYYDSEGTTTIATTSVLPINSPLYIKEQVYNSIGQKSEKIYVINKGPGNQYVRVSYKEGEVFTGEIVVREGEYILLKNVYEIRHRSDIVGLSYRITEHDTSLQTVVLKSEGVETISTDQNIHFTGALTTNTIETINLAGLTSNKIKIIGINGQSKQNLKYRVIFWTSSTNINTTNLNSDTFLTDITMDFSDGLSAFQINSGGGLVNQYYLDINKLDCLYEDHDSTYTLHMSLQNMSDTSKIAGTNGAVQFDIKYALRL